MADIQSKGPRRQLFRHAKVEAPRVLDLGKRLQGIAQVRSHLLGEPQAERKTWVKAHLGSKEHVGGLNALGLGVLAGLDLVALPTDRLPTASVIRNPERFNTALSREPSAVTTATKAVATSLYAAILVADTKQIDSLSQSLQILDALPGLAKA